MSQPSSRGSPANSGADDDGFLTGSRGLRHLASSSKKLVKSWIAVHRLRIIKSGTVASYVINMHPSRFAGILLKFNVHSIVMRDFLSSSSDLASTRTDLFRRTPRKMAAPDSVPEQYRPGFLPPTSPTRCRRTFLESSSSLTHLLWTTSWPTGPSTSPLASSRGRMPSSLVETRVSAVRSVFSCMFNA